MKKLLISLLLIVFTAMAAKIPSGVVLTDRDGITYDIDAILAQGKSIVVHKTQTF